MMAEFFLPYERNPLFLGRQRILADLSSFFAAGGSALKIIELVGMPGIGKTEIAVEYAYQEVDRYQIILWLQAQSRHQLAEHVAEMLSSVGRNLSWKTADQTEHIFHVFRKWLWSRSNFLVIVDQMGDQTVLNDLFEEGMAGHVLMTTASLDTTNQWQSVLVGPFSQEEGTLFLLRRAGLKDGSSSLRKTASAISTEFGGYPLLLDQVGAYVSETHTSLADFLPLYQQDKRTFLDRRGSLPGTHPFSAYSVIAAMRQGSAYFAQDLLKLYVENLIDCSDPSPHLPRNLPASSPLREIASHPSRLLAMRQSLIHNFVLVPLSEGVWGIHPLVLTVLREVYAYIKEQELLSRARDDAYEPLDLEGVLQMLIEVRQLKERLLERIDASEKMQIGREIMANALRLKRAVAPRKRRAQAKARIEHRYAELAYGAQSPINSTSSLEELRQYAEELFALLGSASQGHENSR